MILFSLTFTRGTFAKRLDLADVYTAQRIERGEKFIYERCAKDGDDYVRMGPTKEYNPQGVPIMILDLCGRTKEEWNGDEVKRRYCDSPCEMYCREFAKADAIEIVTDDGKTYYPKVDYDLCNNCGMCFKNCGYHAIEWINSGKIEEGAVGLVEGVIDKVAEGVVEI